MSDTALEVVSETEHPLKAWLRKNGKTQAWLADEVGAHASHLSSLILGRRTGVLSLPICERIEMLTGVPAESLVSPRARRAMQVGRKSAGGDGSRVRAAASGLVASATATALFLAARGHTDEAKALADAANAVTAALSE